jgi:hypothetical protein
MSFRTCKFNVTILLLHLHQMFMVVSPQICLLDLICGIGNFGKIWCACQQHEIQYTE